MADARPAYLELGEIIRDIEHRLHPEQRMADIALELLRATKEDDPKAFAEALKQLEYMAPS